MRFVWKPGTLALCLLLPLTAVGCAGTPSPSSSAAPSHTTVSSAESTASTVLVDTSGTDATTSTATQTTSTVAVTSKTNSSPASTPASTTNVPTTTAKQPAEGFLTEALFATGRDAYGGKSINILGDSISHGANAPNIPEDSYVGLLKKSVAKKFGVYNYGYTSLLCAFSNPSGLYEELHTVDLEGGWNGIGSATAGDHLGFQYYRSTVGNAEMTFTVERGSNEIGRFVKGFYIYYEAGPDLGSFRVEVNGETLATVDCRQEKKDTCMRSPYIALPASLKGRAKIKLVKEAGAPIAITGISYAEDPSGVTVQNYSRSGLQLVEVGDEVIDSVCRSNVLMLAIGFNDAGMQADHITFRNKINRIIQRCEAFGTKVVVIDTLWTFAAEKEFYRAELKRVADELGGLYITFTDLVEKNPGMIQDTAHPTVDGHKLIAARICEKLGLPIPE